MTKLKVKKVRVAPPPKKLTTELLDDLVYEAKLAGLYEEHGTSEAIEASAYKVKTARSKVLAIIYQLEQKIQGAKDGNNTANQEAGRGMESRVLF